MNIIIVGCGKVGATLAKQLSKERHDVSVIDINDKVVEEFANSHDIMGIVGNGAAYSIQKEAGIEKADLLIAVTGSDELNLLCCLIARKAGNCETIAKVRNPIYNSEIGFIKEELGLSMIVNPEYEAASEISRILRFPSAIDINVFDKGQVELLNFKVEKNSILDGIKVQDIIRNLKSDILISMVERGDEVIIPHGEFIIKENDILSLVAPHKKATEFFMKIGIIKNPVRNAMLIGGGHISYYLAKRLLKYGIGVTLVEQDRERCEELSELIPKAVVINGDGTDKELLMEEGISDVESFVSLTGLDERNLLLSLYAKNKINGKVITKLNKVSFDEVIDNLDLGSIIDTKFITMQHILQYVRAMNNSIGSNVKTLYKIKRGKAEALEFYVNENSKVLGTPLQQLNLKENLLICSIKRDGKIITPHGQDYIKKGDHVIVVTTNVGLQDLSDILRG